MLNYWWGKLLLNYKKKINILNKKKTTLHIKIANLSHRNFTVFELQNLFNIQRDEISGSLLGHRDFELFLLTSCYNTDIF